MISSNLWPLVLSIACFFTTSAQAQSNETDAQIPSNETVAQFQEEFIAVTPNLTSSPYTPSQFMNIGSITALTLDDPTDLMSGGTISVDGIEMIIPRNTLVTTPNIAVAWSEMFVDGVPQMPLWPEISWKASVFGNQMGDDWIVGLVFIIQDPFRIITGFINEIDTATSHFRLGGDSNVPGSGIEMVINDPIGRYGLPYLDNPLWASDTDNPSITSLTGMPMCIQRPFVGNLTDDPLCPSKNRPLRDSDGQPHTQIQFVTASARGKDDPDPNFFVPLAVGDYVTITGTQVTDSLLAVYNLIANVGIYTVPGELPSYIRVQEAQFAITGPLAAETGETRAVAFITDPTVSVSWFAMDVDQCTGATTFREMLNTSPFATLAGQIGGELIFRGNKIDFSPATRNVQFRSVLGTMFTNNSITAGQSTTPINGFANGFIFAEITVIGDQEFPLEFDTMPFLSQGSGPFLEQNQLTVQPDNPPIVGQLDPWPGATPPTVTCPVGVVIPPTSTPTVTPVAPDEITIVSVVFARERAVTSYTVQAISSDTSGDAQLTISGTGPNPLGAFPMQNLGNGMYTLSFQVKSALDVITIISSEGGVATDTP